MEWVLSTIQEPVLYELMNLSQGHSFHCDDWLSTRPDVDQPGDTQGRHRHVGRGELDIG